MDAPAPQRGTHCGRCRACRPEHRAPRSTHFGRGPAESAADSRFDDSDAPPAGETRVAQAARTQLAQRPPDAGQYRLRQQAQHAPSPRRHSASRCRSRPPPRASLQMRAGVVPGSCRPGIRSHSLGLGATPFWLTGAAPVGQLPPLAPAATGFANADRQDRLWVGPRPHLNRIASYAVQQGQVIGHEAPLKLFAQLTAPRDPCVRDKLMPNTRGDLRLRSIAWRRNAYGRKRPSRPPMAHAERESGHHRFLEPSAVAHASHPAERNDL